MMHCARATRVQYASPLISGNFDSDVKIGTMIKFCEQISIANVTRCCGASCTCARANWKGTFVVKQSLMLKLPKWYIYDFGPRQCLAMPASSDKSADALP